MYPDITTLPLQQLLLASCVVIVPPGGKKYSIRGCTKSGGSGSEIFLSACGLMASGARTILISRWRPGGQTSYDLVREFVQELPYTSATDAWQRSVELVTESDLIAEREPRLRATGLERPLNARHPFFWAGFALIDSSNAPVAGGEKMAEK